MSYAMNLSHLSLKQAVKHISHQYQTGLIPQNPAIHAKDMEGNCVYVNDRTIALYGLTKDLLKEMLSREGNKLVDSAWQHDHSIKVPQYIKASSNGVDLNRKILVSMKVDKIITRDGHFLFYQQTYQSEEPLLRSSMEEGEIKFSPEQVKKLRVISPRSILRAHQQSPEMAGICLGPVYQYISHAVQMQLGYAPEEWLGKELWDFVHPDDLDKAHLFYASYLAKHALGASIPPVQLKFLHKIETQPINYELVFYDVTDPDYPNAIGIAFRNINELLKAKQEAAHIEIIAQKRLSILGHELLISVAPMSGLLNEMIEKLREISLGWFSSQLKEVEDTCVLAKNRAEIAARRCHSEVRTVEKGGQLTTYNVPTNLHESLMNLVKFMTLDKNDKVQFLHEIDPALSEVMLQMDFPFLDSIIVNFIKNSKRSVISANRPIKTVILTANIVSMTESFCVVYFSVKDTGKGFGKNFTKLTHSQVFEGKDQPAIIDHGLGLVRSVEKIKILGGELYITSNTNEGSLLEFTLTFQKAPHLALPLPLTHSPSTSSEVGDTTMISPIHAIRSIQAKAETPSYRFNVLVVEDDPINARVVLNMLSKFNIDCKLARDGEEAVQVCRNEEFDFMFFDYGLPKKDGQTACREIQEILKGRNTTKMNYIFGLTADSTNSSIEEGIAAGMKFVYTKPMDVETVLKGIVKEFFPDLPLVRLPSPLTPTPRALNKQFSLRKMSKGSTPSSPLPATREMPVDPSLAADSTGVTVHLSDSHVSDSKD